MTGSLDRPTVVNPTANPDYSAHPLLDPDVFRHNRHLRVDIARQFRDHLVTDWHYSRLLNRLLHPIGEEHPLEVNERILASYFDDADSYVRHLALQLPEPDRAGFLPLSEVEECDDLRRLAGLLLGPDTSVDARVRFEAQRKLVLTKLLIQIDNTRMVQDGPRHREYLLHLLEREVWSYIKESREAAARYAGDDASGDAETWRFKLRRVVRDLPGGTYDLDIYHFDTRFKRETGPYDYTPGRSSYEVAEQTLYDRMERGRSGSILSKMLRKQLNDPASISDMLGMKFIVANEADVHRLVDLLHQVLGGPFLFRNQVDLFRHPEDRHHLNRFSSPGFRVFKEDLDLYFPAGESRRGRSYLFSVELQIFTVDSFLRTVHSRDYASHTEYKRRQFLTGVLPYVFPATLYGVPQVL